ncbi:hypothetical protein WJX72_001882 [[Myrmecia] bisecta]|uniref:Uncharacterized protein n=1 Tax=[Myrmecia] bisecta TaxID=41462 RepID=A0AAW1PJQ4_9CHLO
MALRLPNSSFLVDCGEGTSVQMGEAGINMATIRKIFVTHMHGDHVFGLPGVLRAVSAARRGTPLAEEPVCVFGPPGIHQLLYTALYATASPLSMPLAVMEYVLDEAHSRPAHQVTGLGKVRFAHLAPDPDSQPRSPNGRPRNMHQVPVVPGLKWTIRCEDGLTVTAAQLQHRVPCWGYVMKEADQPSQINVALVKELGGSPEALVQYVRARARSITLDTPIQTAKGPVELGMLLTPGIPGRKIVLLGDTCNSAAVAELAQGADLVSHEATFARGMEEKAHIAQHSTADMAGAFARCINARDLVLTHFSARYTPTRKEQHGGRGTFADDSDAATADGSSDINSLIWQAQQAFGRPNVQAAADFSTFVVPQHETQLCLPGAAAGRPQPSGARTMRSPRMARGVPVLAGIEEQPGLRER